MTKEEVSKLISLDLPENLSSADEVELKSLVGQFVVDSILDMVGQVKSPVKGGDFKSSLTKDYRQRKDDEGGTPIPNLEMDGDMLAALTYKIVGDGVEVGIFNKRQAIKAFGHNTGFEGHPTIPEGKYTRQFIPTEDEEFVASINRGIKDIIREFTSGS